MKRGSHPISALQTGNGHLVFWQRDAAGFVEDNIRLKPNLSVTLGLRYYYQNYFNNDTNNFAPRFGFAYSPEKRSKMVFRGGAGIFYDRSGPRAIADLLHFNGVNLLRFLLPNNPTRSCRIPVTPADLQGVPTSLVAAGSACADSLRDQLQLWDRAANHRQEHV